MLVVVAVVLVVLVVALALLLRAPLARALSLWPGQRQQPDVRVWQRLRGYGAGVASPVVAPDGSTRMASLTAGSWPSLRISPATLAGM